MLAQPAVFQPAPRKPKIWLTGLVAAVCALIIGGALLVGLGDSQPPATNPSSGVGISTTKSGDQQITEPSPTPKTPILEAVRDLPVQAGPGAEYAVLMMLEAGGKLDITGISENGVWYQVLVPGGSFGWITVSAALITVYGDLDDLSVVIVPTPTITPSVTPNLGATISQHMTATAEHVPTSTPTATPTRTATPRMPPTFIPAQLTATYMIGQATQNAAASPTPTITPTSILNASGTMEHSLTATAMYNEMSASAMATPSPIPFQLEHATLSPENFTGIYPRMWRKYSKYSAYVEPLWSKDGRYLLVLYDDSFSHKSKIDIHDMHSSEPPVTISPETTVTAMAINPPGTALALGTQDGEVRLYILPDAEDFVALDVCEEECTVTDVVFNPPGTYLSVRSESEQAQYVHVYHLPEVFYR